MTIFGKLKNLFSLKQEKRQEREDLNKLADQISRFCNICVDKQIESHESDLEKYFKFWCKQYIQIAIELYEIVLKIQTERKDSNNSDLLKSLKDQKVFDDVPFKGDTFNDNEDRGPIKKYSSKFEEIKSPSEQTKFVININKWLSKFDKVKGGRFTVWTEKIKKAIKDLQDKFSDQNLSKICEKFIKAIEIEQNKEREQQKNLILITNDNIGSILNDVNLFLSKDVDKSSEDLKYKFKCWCVKYIEIAIKLYKIFLEIKENIKDSGLLNSLEEQKVFDDIPFKNDYIYLYGKLCPTEFKQIDDLNEQTEFVINISNWLGKFNGVELGKSTVWTEKIKEVIIGLNNKVNEETLKQILESIKDTCKKADEKAEKAKKENEKQRRINILGEKGKDFFNTIENIFKNSKEKLSINNLIEFKFHGHTGDGIFREKDIEKIKKLSTKGTVYTKGDISFEKGNFDKCIDKLVELACNLVDYKYHLDDIRALNDQDGVYFKFNSDKIKVSINNNILTLKNEKEEWFAKFKI